VSDRACNILTAVAVLIGVAVIAAIDGLGIGDAICAPLALVGFYALWHVLCALGRPA
jgi:hypothetical protein